MARPKAQAGDQVEREDRDRAELARDGQEQEGRDDRKASDQERQRGGDQAPEEEEREQEEDREGEELRALEVGFDVLVDLLLRDGVAADEDVVLALELGDQRLAGVLERVVLGGLELDGHVGGLAVLRDERSRTSSRRKPETPRTPSTPDAVSETSETRSAPSGVVGVRVLDRG